MKTLNAILLAAFALVISTILALSLISFRPSDANISKQVDAFVPLISNLETPEPEAKPLPAYLKKSLDWLAEAQFENGGWGAGSHSMQNVRDPRAVPVDPATTAFSAMALLRAGSTPDKGPYKTQVNKALDYLLDVVESTPDNQANLTTLTGTQPQRKLGQNIDVAMTTQFLSRIIPLLKKDKDREYRVGQAIDKCVQLLENSQYEDGSWNTAGWAPVLNSVMANNALELSARAGRTVNPVVLENSRQYQRSNFAQDSDNIATGKAAGIQLYALASTQRATAEEANEVKIALKSAKVVEEPKNYQETLEVLEQEGYKKKDAERLAYSYSSNVKAKKQLQNDAVLSGFGNNGGEEYLSHMMTSESLVTTGDESWDEWYSKMSNRFAKVQNENGSWSGHHCITSPVFCTAAVILSLTADRDAAWLKENPNKG